MTIEEYLEKWKEIIPENNFNADKETIIKITNHNKHIIERKLLKSKECFLEYKKFILCGNAPVRKADLKNYQEKAKHFSEILKKLHIDEEE